MESEKQRESTGTEKRWKARRKEKKRRESRKIREKMKLCKELVVVLTDKVPLWMKERAVKKRKEEKRKKRREYDTRYQEKVRERNREKQRKKQRKEWFLGLCWESKDIPQELLSSRETEDTASISSTVTSVASADSAWVRDMETMFQEESSNIDEVSAEEANDDEPLRDVVGVRLRQLRQCRPRALDAKMQSWRANAQWEESSIPLQPGLRRLRRDVFDRQIERGPHDRVPEGL